MDKRHLFICGGAIVHDSFSSNFESITHLSSYGGSPNVNISFQDVVRVFAKHLGERLVDFVEIASYVYAADSATYRGRSGVRSGATDRWARKMHFVIPVRDVEFWQNDSNSQLLRTIVHTMSDDQVNFEFVPLVKEREIQHYLDLAPAEDWPFYDVDRVILFSGGLDSLAGAVQEISSGRNVVLVSHRSVHALNSRQKDLFDLLKKFAHGKGVHCLHVPVWVNKDSRLNGEYTQRTRSLLFAAIATAVASSVRSAGVRFFENGIVSLNFPVADEVQRARASRTTHPEVLEKLSRLCEAILGRGFVIDNPFINLTKKEVLEIVARCGAQQLIVKTCSCAHTFGKSRTQWHCGTCSQCIDRRVAILGANLSEFESEDDYRVDVFSGKRENGYEYNMATDYVRHGFELARMNDDEMLEKFQLELSKATRSFANRTRMAEEFISMHRRHGETVKSVVMEQVRANIDKLPYGEIDRSCLISRVLEREHLEPPWVRFATRIAKFLRLGLPKACENHKPKDEPHLQEICDGILVGANLELQREFPFHRWASRGTKPDWSSEEVALWIELKYVRKKSDIRGITEDIAADITKYTDSGKRILFIIYDPEHCIVDETDFEKDIERHAGIKVVFIR